MKNVTRFIAATLAALGVTFAALAVPTSTAQAADTRRCVSMREAQRVDESNLSIGQIHRIFDTRGRFEYVDEDTSTSGRTYRSCRRGTLVQVDYKRDGAGVWRWWNQALYEP